MPQNGSPAFSAVAHIPLPLSCRRCPCTARCASLEPRRTALEARRSLGRLYTLESATESFVCVARPVNGSHKLCSCCPLQVAASNALCIYTYLLRTRPLRSRHSHTAVLSEAHVCFVFARARTPRAAIYARSTLMCPPGHTHVPLLPPSRALYTHTSPPDIETHNS